MAHQTNVHVIHRSFEPENPSEKVSDPVCGTELARRHARHMLFRTGETLYFCSQGCRDKFLDPRYQRKPPSPTAALGKAVDSPLSG